MWMYGYFTIKQCNHRSDCSESSLIRVYTVCTPAGVSFIRYYSFVFVSMLYVPVNTFSVMSGLFLGWTSTKQRIRILLKYRTQYLRWGSNQRPLDLKSTATALLWCYPYSTRPEKKIKYDANVPGGYSHFSGPASTVHPPKNIRNFKHPQNIFEIIATQKNIPHSVYWQLKKRP